MGVISSMLELIQVSKIFRTVGGNAVTALEGLDLEIERNQLVCVVGLSGCGKTTTLRLVAGLDKPSSGRIILDGAVINGPTAERCVVFQKYTLFPWRNVLDNVAFGLETQGIGKKKRIAIARRYLELVGLVDYGRAYPYELSGGMQQRVAVARALAANPKVLLMDEPFGALDARTRSLLQNELVRVWEQEQKTILFVTHSINEAVYLADRVIVMQSGPGRIKGIVPIDLARPRDKNNGAFKDLSRSVYRMLTEN